MGESLDEILKDVYYNPESGGSFGGAKKLYIEAVKKDPSIKLDSVKQWLTDQSTYSLFRQAKKRFLRLPIIVDHIDEQWQADLLDMTWLSSANDGVKYILVVVDILSRYAWAVPIKQKSAQSLVQAFTNIFSAGRKPKKLQTDRAKEFVNASFKRLMDEEKINHFVTTDDLIKCAIAERFNRTLRSRIYRYIHSKKNERYIDKLKEIVDGYNNSFHRIIRTSPASVNKENQNTILINIRKNHKKSYFTPKPLKVGDFVRITRAKGVFEKGATENWTQEIFEIRKVKKTSQGYIYRLKDLDGEEITSVFYHFEIQQVKKPEVFTIERIIKERYNTQHKKKEYFVKFLGYPDKFNQWVDYVDAE